MYFVILIGVCLEVCFIQLSAMERKELGEAHPESFLWSRRPFSVTILAGCARFKSRMQQYLVPSSILPTFQFIEDEVSMVDDEDEEEEDEDEEEEEDEDEEDEDGKFARQRSSWPASMSLRTLQKILGEVPTC